jgi:hypothetical protein
MLKIFGETSGAGIRIEECLLGRQKMLVFAAWEDDPTKTPEEEKIIFCYR